MVEPVGSDASDKTSHPNKTKRCGSSTLSQAQKRSGGGLAATEDGLYPEMHSLASAEVTDTSSSSLFRTVHGGDQRSHSPPTPSHSPAVPASNSVSIFKSLSGSRRPLQHNPQKALYAAKTSSCENTQPKQRQVSPYATHLPALSTTHIPKPWPSTPGSAYQPQAPQKPSINPTLAAGSSCIASSITPTPSYVIAQGHQVYFEEQSSTWRAQVQDVWGRTQVLPVIGAPDQTLREAIEALASKAPGQHKYCVHILETDQPPWAPRVVYVGAMGLRGGEIAQVVVVSVNTLTTSGQNTILMMKTMVRSGVAESIFIVIQIMIGNLMGACI